MSAVYSVEYKLTSTGKVNTVGIVAKNKVDAWDKATFEEIPRLTGEQAYSSWVSSVTYSNGNYRKFNNFEGKPY